MKYRNVKKFIGMIGTNIIQRWDIVQMEGEQLFTLLINGVEKSKNASYFGAHYDMMSEVSDFMRNENSEEILIKG